MLQSTGSQRVGHNWATSLSFLSDCCSQGPSEGWSLPMVLKCLKEQGPYPNVIVKSYHMLSKDKIYHPKCLSKIGIINNSIFPLNVFYGQKKKSGRTSY